MDAGEAPGMLPIEVRREGKLSETSMDWGIVMGAIRFMIGVATCLVAASVVAGDEGLEFDDSWYQGFSQGAYYGLMLAGEDYHVAWCMKSELEYEAQGFGTGADFQKKMEALLATCRAAAQEDNSG